MPTLEEIRQRFSEDRFATETAGIKIKEAEPGRAVCVMEIGPHHLNANHVPQGGAVFTLGDFTFAVAANGCSNTVSVSQQAAITFLAPAKGKTLTAEASCLKAGRRTCLYKVEITDELGVYVAHMTINGFTL